jgi:hypothetical protein
VRGCSRSGREGEEEEVRAGEGGREREKVRLM